MDQVNLVSQDSLVNQDSQVNQVYQVLDNQEIQVNPELEVVMEMVMEQDNQDSLVNPDSQAYQVTAVEPAGVAVTVTAEVMDGAVEMVTEAAVLAVHQILPNATYVGLSFKYYQVDHGHQLVNLR